jgi:hypothetical protein
MRDEHTVGVAKQRFRQWRRDVRQVQITGQADRVRGLRAHARSRTVA